MSTEPNRHLSRTALDEYLALAAPATIVVPGEPSCRVVIDPVHGEMSLRTPFRGKELDLAEFEHVQFRLLTEDGRVWQEVVIIFNGHPHEAYLLLSDIADMTQQGGLDFGLAVRLTLRTFRELIARHSSLTAEQQVGLYGELLLLEHFLKILPGSTVIDFWKGFTAHEHDFVLPGLCVEVKTTKSEKRRHQIGVACQRDGTAALPRPRDHWGLFVMVICSPRGVNKTRRCRWACRWFGGVVGGGRIRLR
jgi:Putative  PD-(D/E)XK family member, (DUF4420)